MSTFWNLKRKLSAAVLTILLVLNILAFKEVLHLAGPHHLTVTVLDIGQGDSILIETPGLRHILIDGGPGVAVLGKLQQKLPFWERSLDAVILTHPDSDHLNGLLYVLQKYQVDHIFWTGMVRDGQAYDQWVSLVHRQQSQGSRVIAAKLGQRIKNAGMSLDIIHPFEDLTGQFFGKQDNDTGVVARLQYGSRSFLFTADISSVEEQAMIDKGVPLNVDVLKVAHHGSKYSTSEAFLQLVHPSLAVISVGKDNTYGHPTPEVLQRLANFGITTLRTDQRGDVAMISDGKKIQLK